MLSKRSFWPFSESSLTYTLVIGIKSSSNQVECSRPENGAQVSDRDIEVFVGGEAMAVGSTGNWALVKLKNWGRVGSKCQVFGCIRI